MATLATLSLPMTANAEPGPLSPWKYHTTAGQMGDHYPAFGAQYFVMYFDQLDPSGRHTNIGGFAARDAFAAVAVASTYDPTQGHYIFNFTGTIDTMSTSPEPFSGQLFVTYDRDNNVHTIGVDAVKDGEHFTVPPMTVIV